MRLLIVSGHQTGQVVDLPQAEAENAIATGFAGPVSPEAPATEPETIHVVFEAPEGASPPQAHPDEAFVPLTAASDAVEPEVFPARVEPAPEPDPAPAEDVPLEPPTADEAAANAQMEGHLVEDAKAEAEHRDYAPPARP